MFKCSKCHKLEKEENRCVEYGGQIVCFDCFDKKTVERIERNSKSVFGGNT